MYKIKWDPTIELWSVYFFMHCSLTQKEGNQVVDQGGENISHGCLVCEK